MPERTFSGTPGIGRGSAGCRCIASAIAPKQSAARSSVLPEPAYAANAPASAGPIARARLNATAPSVTARASSARVTRSLTMALAGGR